jgi:hypothetical protein
MAGGLHFLRPRAKGLSSYTKRGGIMSRSFSTELECGCLIAEMDTDGWEGLSDCGIDYYTDGEIAVDKKLKARKKLHDECWEKYLKERKND